MASDASPGHLGDLVVFVLFVQTAPRGLAQETDAVDDVSADLEKALWEDLATEDDIDDRRSAERVDQSARSSCLF